MDDGSTKNMYFPVNSTISTPSEQLVGEIGGSYLRIGFEFLGHLIELAKLRRDDNVLDIGCGCGRIAYPLAHFLDDSGRYFGFDIMAHQIEWTQRSFCLDNFTFSHANIYNREYNPAGHIKAVDFVFPVESESISLAIATSLYTHLLRDDFRHYLYETARILQPGGRAFLTLYVMNDDSKQAVKAGIAKQNLKPLSGEDGLFTSNIDVPEAAIGIDEELLSDWINGAGLDILQFIPGYWAANNAPTYQDVLVLCKC
jgi:SAM-dependent methyltransferase